MVLGELVELGPCVSAETVKACALMELVRLGPSILPHGELLLLLVRKEPAFVPDSEAFNSFVGDGFLVPELKGGSEASEDDQADKWQ